ncbi:MAG: iron ABC transporter permease [Spirochaetes bacterium]|nr:iron ABC transporter permease [Spirochaetota bacterium]
MSIRKKKKWALLLAGIVLALFIISFLSLVIGTKDIKITDVFSIALNGKGTTEYSILFDIRLPRILMGFAIGGALSLAGAILQGIFRNPLVEPYTLGISGGATLGVSLNLVFGISRSFGILSMPLFGFLGAFFVILILYSLSLKKGVIKMNGLLLTGVMISFVSSSLLMLLQSITTAEDLQGIIFWIMGSLDESNWLLIKMCLCVSIAGLLLSYILCLDLNALALGEEEALHLGISVERSKRFFFIIASVLTGLSVSLAGVIAFVGLIVPHFLRMFIGGDHRILLVSSYLAGAGFLIFCDTLSRTIAAPLELPVGVVTGIIGGSFFVYAISRRGLLWEN